MGRAESLKGAGHFYLVMAQMITGKAGKDLLVHGVMKAVDLPVFRKQHPVGRLDQAKLLVKMGGFNIGNGRQAQGTERIKRYNTHGTFQLSDKQIRRTV